MPRYVIRRKLFPVPPVGARRQLVVLTFHQDPDVALLAALELLDRTGHERLEIAERSEERTVCHVHERWWLNTVMPRRDLVEWRVRVQSARRRRWARLSTRVGEVVSAGLAS